MDKYKEYKDSGIEWLGEIPSHWKNKKIKNVIKENLVYGAQLSGDINAGYFRYIRITDIDSNGNLKENILKKYLSFIEGKNYQLEKGDLLFARSGATVGKTFLYDSDERSAYAGYLIRARFNRLVFPKFLYFFTNSGSYENWKNYIFEKSTIENIAGDKYRDLIFALPSYKEQTAIANFLDEKTGTIDSAVKELEKQRKLLKELKQATIHKAVTKGLDENAPMKDSGVEWIGEIPKHWNIVRFKDLFNMKNKKHGFKKPQLFSLTMKGLKKRDINSSEGQVAESYDKYNEIDLGDFIMNPMDLKSGFADVAKEKGIISPAYTMFSLKNKEAHVNEFYNKYIQMHYHEKIFHPFGKGVSLEHRWVLTNKTLLFWPFLSINKKEQEQIVNHLNEKISKINDSLEEINLKIEHLKEYKKTLINDAVTGKIKVYEGEIE